MAMAQVNWYPEIREESSVSTLQIPVLKEAKVSFLVIGVAQNK